MREGIGEVSTPKKPFSHAEGFAFDALAGIVLIAAFEDDDGGLPVIEVFSGLAALKSRDTGECVRGQALERSGRAGGTQFVLQKCGHHPQVCESAAPIEIVEVGVIQDGDAGRKNCDGS